MDREDVERIVKIQVYGFEGIWDIVDEMIQLAKIADLFDSTLNRHDMGRHGRLEYMVEEVAESDRI